MKKPLITLFLMLLLIGVGAGVTYTVWATKLNSPDEHVVFEAEIPNVAVRVLRPEAVEDLLILAGSTEAWKIVTLSAETTGKIEWQGIEEGQTVTLGQKLIRINTTSAEARMAQAKAQFLLADQDLRRVQDLREDGISSPQELDRALATCDAARASLRLTEIVLDQSVVIAELHGVVDKLYREKGEFVTAGSPLIRIVQLDRIKVLTGIPERDIPNFRIGDAVQVLVNAYPDRQFSGRIHRISPTASMSTRTFLTEIEVGTSDGELKPGMMARAIFVRNTYPSAITVPMFSVMDTDEARFVFLDDDGTARQRAVELGFFRAGFVHVTRGLSEGERLIVAGHRDLQNGQPIRVGKVD
ncbi:MAG: efflux RND transporter periplasmic adaptor subunit [Candidatus Hydrogenedentes bacterium]|nr:efflux RND transporter periplasmic adaptor subunit [Candidatus Hydrogenedentota bacterium]